MYYSVGLEDIVGNYSTSYTSKIHYFSKISDGDYSFGRTDPLVIETQYADTYHPNNQYTNQKYLSHYFEHHFAPQIFLSPSRPKARFIDDEEQINSIVEETFQAMMSEALPKGISMNILPFDEFKALHSGFESWSNGILGFSINGHEKKIFVRENHIDELLIVIGHEIGHVLTITLPNKHDEEAKAFAFTIEWAKTIKQHNIGNLGLSIKDEFDFNPARNGLHDVAFSFVDMMVKKGRKAKELHDDLVKKYMSIFNRVY